MEQILNLDTSKQNLTAGKKFSFDILPEVPRDEIEFHDPKLKIFLYHVNSKLEWAVSLSNHFGTIIPPPIETLL